VAEVVVARQQQQTIRLVLGEGRAVLSMTQSHLQHQHIHTQSAREALLAQLGTTLAATVQRQLRSMLTVLALALVLALLERLPLPSAPPTERLAVLPLEARCG
jgi:hypothetical protein